jgi:hypothetical protein
VYAEPLKKGMQEEARLLNDYAARLGGLQGAVGRRDWESVEREIAGLRNLAGEVEGAEAARLEAYRSLKAALLMSGDPPFDQVASRLESPAREELAEAHRRLKIAIIRVKGASGLLGYYVRSMADTRRQVLEELLPHRKGRMYSRSGRTRATAEESLMLDGKY